MPPPLKRAVGHISQGAHASSAASIQTGVATILQAMMELSEQTRRNIQELSLRHQLEQAAHAAAQQVLADRAARREFKSFISG